jgi:hypothetical protein
MNGKECDEGRGICKNGICSGEEITVTLDIKPGACPNPLQVKSKGVLPVAIAGAEDIDVAQIDVSTIRLGRKGITDTVAPLRWNYEDAARPFDGGEPCDCQSLTADGYADLMLRFDTQEVVNSLKLNSGFEFKEMVQLQITGNLKQEFGGTPIKGEDCIRWQNDGKTSLRRR